jgi:hypothetical protein
MDSEVRALYQRTLIDSLSLYERIRRGQLPTELNLVWRRNEANGWNGVVEALPSLRLIAICASEALAQINSAFADLYAERCSPWVGIDGLAGMQLTQDAAWLAKAAIHTYWSADRAFDPDARVEQAVNALEHFTDAASLRLCFQTLLWNFSSEEDLIDIGFGLQIRRMSCTELNACYGGPLTDILFGMKRGAGRLHEFVLAGSMPALKSSGPFNGIDYREMAFEKLDRTTQCMRAFKPGPVGFDAVSFSLEGFSPLPMGSFGRGEIIPGGEYRIAASESAPLGKWHETLAPVTEPAMLLACSRLADAEIRRKPEDKILDAVIGMEALLLADHVADKGELSFRLSSRFAALESDITKRRSAFKLAKDLYSLRSVVAHGTPLKSPVKLGSERVDPSKAANIATETLRSLIVRLVPMAAKKEYGKPEFWLDAFYGPAGTSSPACPRSAE